MKKDFGVRGCFNMEKINFVGIRYCLKCGDETEHELIYLDKYLKAGRCILCNQQFDNRGILMRIYYQDFAERVLIKPLKIYKDLKKIPKQKKFWLFFQYIGQFLNEPKKEFNNLRQMYKRHVFK